MFFFIRGTVLAIVAGVLLILGFTFHQGLDWRFFSLIHHGSQPPSLSQLTIIDLPYDEDRVHFRANVGAFLSELAKQKTEPNAVVLDMWFEKDATTASFGDNPCGEGHKLRPAGINELERGLCELKAKDIPVYAVINPFDRAGQMTANYIDNHLGEIYQVLLAGAGHTRLDSYGSILKYDPQLEIGSGISIPALPVKIAEDLSGRSVTEGNYPIVITPGTTATLMSGVITFKNGKFYPNASQTPLSAQPDFKKRLVLVGSFSKDRLEGLNRYGPEMLGWAIAERIASADSLSSQNQLMRSPGREISFYILLLALPLGTFLIFRHLYGSKPQWKLKPFLPASISALAMLLTLMAFVIGALLLGGKIFPQVALISQLIISVAIFCWLYTWVVISKLAGQESHDVFISYSHTPQENMEWVKREIYEPLKARLPATRIFFDTGIPRWSDWANKIDNGLIGSKVIVVVLSQDYLNKPFCRYELGVALRRRDMKSCKVLVIRRDTDTLHFPWHYRHLARVLKGETGQYATVDQHVTDEEINEIALKLEHEDKQLS